MMHGEREIPYGLITVHIVVVHLAIALTAWGFIVLEKDSLFHLPFDYGDNQYYISGLNSKLHGRGLDRNTFNEARKIHLKELADAMVGCGIVQIVLSIFAIIGHVMGKKRKLTSASFLIVVAILVITEVVFCVLYGERSAVKSSMHRLLKRYNERQPDKFNAYWSLVMSAYHCCGVDGGWDFDVIDGWDRNSSGRVPAVCCDNIGAVYRNPNGRIDCRQSHWNHNGCFEQIWGQIRDQTHPIVFFLVAHDVMQLLSAALEIVHLQAWIKDRSRVKPNAVAPTELVQY